MNTPPNAPLTPHPDRDGTGDAAAGEARTHDELRKRHFARLNDYRRSAEYADYARRVGADVPDGPLPSLLGRRWEIDRAIHDEFLEMLPPLGWRGDTFYLAEFAFDDVTAKFGKEGDVYYCEFARYPARDQGDPPVRTPWGVARHATVIAPGIVSYSTASHGGIHLSAERVAEMPEPLREFVPFGGRQAGPGRWFEEDCDWSVVALAFPQFFDARDLAAARATLRTYRPELYARVCGPDPTVTPGEVRAPGPERSV